MFDRILVICAGNICRSPLGEVVLAKMLPNKYVASAGLVAKNGMAADPHSVAIAADVGLDLSQHQAQRLTAKLCSEYDLLLVMEPQHQRDIAAKYPEASGKTMLLGRWINVDEIPDPHKQSREAFDHAYGLIEESCAAWASRLGN